MPQLCPRLQRAVTLSREKGSFSWLVTLPLSDHGFVLHKGAFRDTLCIRYGWQPSLLPSSCVCGKSFTIDHCLSCPCGGFPSIRHNKLRDITAAFYLKFVTMLVLNHLCNHLLVSFSLIAQLMLRMSLGLTLRLRVFGVVTGGWLSLTGIKVFNLFAPSYLSSSDIQCFRRAELKRKGKHERVREVERGTFSPLVFWFFIKITCAVLTVNGARLQALFGL